MAKILASAEAVNKGELYTTALQTQQHSFMADEPFKYNGKDAGPSPVDYLCAALASCTVITLRMYVERKQWQVSEINVKVNLVKGSDTPSGNNTFYCTVHAVGSLSEDQQKRLYEIAKACPVHRLLIKPSEVVTIIE